MIDLSVNEAGLAKAVQLGTSSTSTLRSRRVVKLPMPL